MKTTKESTNIIQFQKREKMNESIAKITKIVIGVLYLKSLLLDIEHSIYLQLMQQLVLLVQKLTT